MAAAAELIGAQRPIPRRAHSGTPRPFCNPQALLPGFPAVQDGMHSRAVEWGVTAAQRIMRLTSKTECPPRMNKRPRRAKSSLFSFFLVPFPICFFSSALHPRLTILNNPALASSSSHYRGSAPARQHHLHSITLRRRRPTAHVSQYQPRADGPLLQNSQAGQLAGSRGVQVPSLGLSSSLDSALTSDQGQTARLTGC